MPRKTNETVTTKTRAKAARTPETNPSAPRRHKKATPVAAASSDSIIATEEIAALAFSYWESRGYQGGSPEDDWLRAETELRERVFA
jgi:translation initiation factor IF-2